MRKSPIQSLIMAYILQVSQYKLGLPVAIAGGKRKKPAETRFGCRGCGVLLCQPSERGNCFEEWHKSLQEGENSESA